LSSSDLASFESTLMGGSELSYDSLFASAAEPVLIVEASTEHVVEANPAAAALLRADRAALLGTPFIEAFEEASIRAVKHSLATARAAGRASAISLRTRNGRAKLGLKVSLFRAALDSYLLVRLTTKSAEDAEPVRGRTNSVVLTAIERASVGFLITDAGLRVEYANRAFVDMLGLHSPEQVCGRPLAFWLELTDSDLALLQGQMARRQAATVLQTVVHSTSQGSRRVEVHAVAVPDGRNTRWGFTLREQPRLN
jgi:PAS domain-containing protein